MLVSIQQPEFFPWVGFFNKLKHADLSVIFDNVQFKKRYFENRCRIRTGDQLSWLTVPVLTKGRYHQKIQEVKVDNSVQWGKKLLAQLQHNYHMAPYWRDFSGFLEDLFMQRRWEYLVEINLHIIHHMCLYLEIPFKFQLGSAMGITTESGSELILKMCIMVGATSYLSGHFGREYLDETAFRKAGIEIIYQNVIPSVYPQKGNGFVGPLSILDLALNNGKESIQSIIGEDI